jgi:putative transcriptional regulator
MEVLWNKIIYILFTLFPNLIPNSVEISNGIFWGGDFELTKSLINDHKIKQRNIRFFLGYTLDGAPIN